MLKNYWRYIILFMVVVVIFPVLLTFAARKINHKNENTIQPLKKTVIIENDKYIMEMDVEDFIPCVLMAQMSVDSPIELLKAQAVVIRTYILKQMGNDKKISSKKLGLPYVSYTELEDMWFRQLKIKDAASLRGIIGNMTGLGKSKVFQENMSYLNKAISKTNRKIMKNEGQIILPLYHLTSAGTTRSGKEVLGDEYSYLKSVACSTDFTQENFIGVRYFTLEEFREQLENSGIIIYKDKKELFLADDLDVKEFLKLTDCSKKDKTGYVAFVKIGDTEILAENFAKALNLQSTNFEISQYEKGIRITTKGIGHGFGMSLCYARQLAKEGKSWQDILKFFYKAVIVE